MLACPRIRVRVVAQGTERDAVVSADDYKRKRPRIVWRKGIRLDGISPWWVGIAAAAGFIAGLVTP